MTIPDDALALEIEAIWLDWEWFYEASLAAYRQKLLEASASPTRFVTGIIWDLLKDS